MKEERILYYVPILMHSLKEWASLSRPVLEKRRQIQGPQQTEKDLKEKINQYWLKVIGQFKERNLNTPENCKKMHIYVDGLSSQLICCKVCLEKTGKQYYFTEIGDNKMRCSFCGRIIEGTMEEPLMHQVKMLIESKILFYLLIEKLMGKGAKIHGTESQQLLVEEHKMWENAVQGIEPDPKRKVELLKERDTFIANIINQTLPEEEIGILFIGAAHKVDNELKKFPDIQVIYLEGGD